LSLGMAKLLLAVPKTEHSVFSKAFQAALPDVGRCVK
jgi:hypothetical protein